VVADAREGAPAVAETEFPLKEYLGFEIERGEGRATASLSLDERHHNPNGVAHGAVPFALMDTAMGAAVMSVVDDGKKCATIEIHTRFHASASDGGLWAEAVVLSAGRRIVHLEAKTIDRVGRLIASATGSFAVVEPRSS
jgi:acyl-CoA thioesterase